MIQKFKPTLLLDEVETLKGRSERAEYLRQILNAGNRSGAVATRCVGQGGSMDVKNFSVCCPKIVFGIGTFPPTIADRSICIAMRRRNKKTEHIGRLQTARIEAPPLLDRIIALTGAKREEIEAACRATTLEFLGDRDADSWAPLFAILAVCDPARLPELRDCAEHLTAAKADSATDSLALRLLADIRDVWPESERHVFSAILKDRLREIKDGPWAESEVNLNESCLGCPKGSSCIRLLFESGRRR